MCDAGGNYHQALRQHFEAAGVPAPRMQAMGTIEGVKRGPQAGRHSAPGGARRRAGAAGRRARRVRVRPALPCVVLRAVLAPGAMGSPVVDDLISTLCAASLSGPEARRWRRHRDSEPRRGTPATMWHGRRPPMSRLASSKGRTSVRGVPLSWAVVLLAGCGTTVGKGNSPGELDSIDLAAVAGLAGRDRCPQRPGVLSRPATRGLGLRTGWTPHSVPPVSTLCCRCCCCTGPFGLRFGAAGR